MITSKQIQQLRRAEAAMMAEWSASFVQPCCFNTDGIVDYERWAALPDGKHIVVLLKETNALRGSLVEFLCTKCEKALQPAQKAQKPLERPEIRKRGFFRSPIFRITCIIRNDINFKNRSPFSCLLLMTQVSEASGPFL